jgi:hypothetical protein
MTSKGGGMPWKNLHEEVPKEDTYIIVFRKKSYHLVKLKDIPNDEKTGHTYLWCSRGGEIREADEENDLWYGFENLQVKGIR